MLQVYICIVYHSIAFTLHIRFAHTMCDYSRSINSYKIHSISSFQANERLYSNSYVKKTPRLEHLWYVRLYKYFLMKLHLICINFSSPYILYTLNCHPIQKENDFVSQSRFHNKFNLPFAFQFQLCNILDALLTITFSIVLSIVVGSCFVILLALNISIIFETPSKVSYKTLITLRFHFSR